MGVSKHHNEPKGKKESEVKMANNTMTITAKTSKQEIVDFLTPFTKSRKLEKSLKDRISYTVKKAVEDIKNVTRKDLTELLDDLSKAIPQVVSREEVPAEALKKPLKKTAKEEPPVVEKSKPGKKSKPVAKPKEETAVDSLPAASSVGTDRLPSAKMFPLEIEHPDLGTLKAAVGQFTDFASIRSALDSDKTLYFASYWTKRQLKEFAYAATREVDVPKEGFPFDLDISQAIVTLDSRDRVFALSRYTEALYKFEAEDFEYLTSDDPRGGDKFQVRCSVGMEFEIYVPADEFVEPVQTKTKKTAPKTKKLGKK